MYVLKSQTHKSLFDYEKALETLDLALQEGLKSDKVDEVVANVKAEKAFAYFDIQKYKESALLMNELKKTNYKNLDLGTTAYIVMQDGYLDFLNKNYQLAEKKYNEAIELTKKAGERNLPVVYGKKIELYAKMNNTNSAVQAFNEGMNVARKFDILKYKIYLNEQIALVYEDNKDWKNAHSTLHKLDSMRTVYNAKDNNNKIALLEKDLEIEKKDNEISRAKLFRNSLLVFCAILIFGVYLSIKLYKSNKEKAFLLEKENTRIHDELQILTSSLSSQGFTKVDLSKYNLSERQLEIIELIRLGKSNKEIANQIFISENTVKYHLKTIYEIMNIENRSEFFKLINK